MNSSQIQNYYVTMKSGTANHFGQMNTTTLHIGASVDGYFVHRGIRDLKSWEAWKEFLMVTTGDIHDGHGRPVSFACLCEIVDGGSTKPDISDREGWWRDEEGHLFCMGGATESFPAVTPISIVPKTDVGEVTWAYYQNHFDKVELITLILAVIADEQGGHVNISESALRAYLANNTEAKIHFRSAAGHGIKISTGDARTIADEH